MQLIHLSLPSLHGFGRVDAPLQVALECEQSPIHSFLERAQLAVSALVKGSQGRDEPIHLRLGIVSTRRRTQAAERILSHLRQ